MSWNQPGGSNDDRDKDPWSKESPPDLEELLRKLQLRFAGRFGGGRMNNTPSPGFGAGWIVMILFVLYLISGIYIVQPAERAVVTRFGKYLTTQEPGPHWLPRFIDSKQIVDIESIHTTTHAASMLTQDENIVTVEIAVQYRIENPENYLFNVKQPEVSLREVIKSALRHVVGHTNLDDVLTKGRAVVADQIQEQITLALERFESGLAVVEVAMQPASPPEAVKSAFDDVIRAREDEQRYVNEADAYSRKIWPLAEGDARRMIEEAQAYKAQVVYRATGETQRFLALLPEYQSAPDVTRDRLYLGTMSNILSQVPKVIVDNEGSNLMVLPLEQLFSKNTAGQSREAVNNLDETIQSIRARKQRELKQQTDTEVDIYRDNIPVRSFQRSVRGG